MCIRDSSRRPGAKLSTFAIASSNLLPLTGDARGQREYPDRGWCAAVTVDLVIGNGRIVTPGGMLEGGVAIDGERIVAVGAPGAWRRTCRGRPTAPCTAG